MLSDLDTRYSLLLSIRPGNAQNFKPYMSIIYLNMWQTTILFPKTEAAAFPGAIDKNFKHYFECHILSF